ncbi:MAG TPA: hypothetical protein PKC30_01485 [Saprospiraceae bacterium]|nr:hypothetical protein [Saprospiraceae bacterium]
MTKILLSAILIMAGLIIFLILIILFKKYRRNRKERVRKIFQSIIDQTLFNYLFDDDETDYIKESKLFDQYFSTSLFFKKLTLKSLVTLQNNYTGGYKKKLEHFFVEKNLHQYAMNKLNSVRWPHIVEGIRDLSSMNYTSAAPQINRLLNHSHSMVRSEALLGMIKLNGISELYLMKNSDMNLNDWLQCNIMFVIIQQKLEDPGNLDILLDSSIPSWRIFALRLMQYYKSSPYLLTIKSLNDQNADPLLKIEIEKWKHQI